jgi:syntaxin-binding protein 1
MIVVFPFFSTRDGGEISTRDLQKIVQALPQYSDQVEKLTLHIEVDHCCRKTYSIHDLCSDV